MEYIKGLLSVCCTCYNHEKYIEDCIKSIWNNDCKDVEIIVIDDGSTDKSVEVLKSLQAKSPCRFEIITQENTHNIGLNINRAIAKACGEFITFMSTDDYYTNNAFSCKLSLMNEDKNLAFVVSKNVNVLSAEGELETVNVLSDSLALNSTIEDLNEIEYEKGTFAVQGNIFRHEVIDAVGKFDEDINGDDIVIRTKVLKYLLNHKELKISYVDEVSFVYRKHHNNYSSNISDMINIFLDVYDRYWSDRPYPKFLKNMLEEKIYNIPNQVIPMLNNYPQALDYINSKQELKDFIINEQKNMNSKFIKYIFRKEYASNNRIRLIFFNTIKISVKIQRENTNE